MSCLGSLVENQLTINVRIYFGRLIFILLIFVQPYASITKGHPRSCGGKELSANAGDARDTGLTPGLGRPCGEGNGNPLQYSCLENSMDREAWHGCMGLQRVEHSWANEHAHTHIPISQYLDNYNDFGKVRTSLQYIPIVCLIKNVCSPRQEVVTRLMSSFKI